MRRCGALGPEAHPRSRGENASARSRRARDPGSSPLTRGKLGQRDLIDPEAGLIPAHAGKTACVSRCFRTLRAHPRSRGENIGGDLLMEAGEGSSPLTRGKQRRWPGRFGVLGLIPAHAGKTAPRYPPWDPTGAHPRSRGENSARATSCSTMMGSSPLTRGKRRFGIRGGGAGGLIPAHAGKTCRAGTTLVWNQAHPRSHGENVGGPFAVFGVPGSSPLTRGKPPIFRGTRPVGRLIPAHAGKTRDSRAYPALPPAHPRSRGENEDRKGEARAIEGSSPLTRGKQAWCS